MNAVVALFFLLFLSPSCILFAVASSGSSIKESHEAKKESSFETPLSKKQIVVGTGGALHRHNDNAARDNIRQKQGRNLRFRDLQAVNNVAFGKPGLSSKITISFVPGNDVDIEVDGGSENGNNDNINDEEVQGEEQKFPTAQANDQDAVAFSDEEVIAETEASGVDGNEEQEECLLTVGIRCKAAEDSTDCDELSLKALEEESCREDGEKMLMLKYTYFFRNDGPSYIKIESAKRGVNYDDVGGPRFDDLGSLIPTVDPGQFTTYEEERAVSLCAQNDEDSTKKAALEKTTTTLYVVGKPVSAGGWRATGPICSDYDSHAFRTDEDAAGGGRGGGSLRRRTN